MGNPLRAGVLDTQARSWAGYGPKTGAWNLLEAFDDCGVKAVFYVNGLLGERYPDLMNAIVAEGHSIAAHGWAMNIFPAYQTRDEEAASLERTVGALEKATGQKVLG
jgi:peptidoglycan/xylan/chitin deacetylase (PgdA/CDA1 family)